jgi:alkylated DNA repair protein (DNA oxidative demethylase)
MSLAAMNLFSQLATQPTHEELFPGAVLMRGLALPGDQALLAAVDAIVSAVPFRHMVTPGGLQMHVQSSGCGGPLRFGENPYPRYPGSPGDPPRRRPPMPEAFHAIAIRSAILAGFPRFRPDSGHINRYEAGVKLGLHQDRHECDLSQPIVSVSLGLPAIFLLGGFQRGDPTRRILLEHGDVIVWGGPSRLRFHGVQPLKPGSHPLTGFYRYNLTFRKTL